jgi:hypothetical protein
MPGQKILKRLDLTLTAIVCSSVPLFVPCCSASQIESPGPVSTAMSELGRRSTVSYGNSHDALMRSN